MRSNPVSVRLWGPARLHQRGAALRVQGPLIQARVRGIWAAGEDGRCSRRGLWKRAVQSRKAVVWVWLRPHLPEDPAEGGKGTPSTRQLSLGALT